MKAEYDQKLTDIKASLTGLYRPVDLHRDGLPVWEFGDIKGNNVVVDFNTYSDQLSLVGDSFIAFAFLYAATIVISKKG